MRRLLVMKDVIGETELGKVFGGLRIPNLGIALGDQFKALEGFQRAGELSNHIGVTQIWIGNPAI